MQIAEKIIDWVWLNHLEQIARQAGEAIMGVYAKDFAHWNKVDASPVTEADLLADRLIRAALAAAFPDIPVVSEEFEHSIDPNTNTFFLVDPLDGTKEFLKRNGEFTVNIALIHDGHPVAAVVGTPALGVVYVAAKGLGAVRRDSLGEKQLVVKDRSADMPLRVIGSRSHAAAEMGAWLQQLSQPYLFMAAGSSLKFCRIAEGEADVYPRFGPTSQWDTAAGQCVLEAAGGTVSTLDGTPLCYGLNRPMLNPQFVARGG
jgi:3'(2'), 5'-bisphosphate nucleotidase